MPVLTLGAICGFLTVALGAFGAHGLKGHLTEEGMGWWETATFYALAHAVLLVAIGLNKTRATDLFGPSIAIFIGLLIFAGSLYAMALGAPRWFGAITPIGGTSLLVGWAWLAFAGFRSEF